MLGFGAMRRGYERRVGGLEMMGLPPIWDADADVEGSSELRELSEGLEESLAGGLGDVVELNTPPTPWMTKGDEEEREDARVDDVGPPLHGRVRERTRHVEEEKKGKGKGREERCGGPTIPKAIATFLTRAAAAAEHTIRMRWLGGSWPSCLRKGVASEDSCSGRTPILSRGTRRRKRKALLDQATFQPYGAC